MERWTIASLLETAAGYLREKASTTPRLDAELLLASVLGLDRVHLYTQYDRPLTSAEVDHYRTLIARRARHEPVAYILGRAHFRRLVLEVEPAVLIPRPETEELVEVALQTIRERPVWECDEDGRPYVADIGTGSGAIALSLAQEAGVQVLATEVSPQALAVAERNRAAAGLDESVELRRADLLAGVPDRSLRLIVSNPPYVTVSDMSVLAPDVRLFEPRAALDGGSDGLDVYRRLLPEAARALMPGGTLLVEVGHDQAATVAQMAREDGFALITIHKDLSGKERMVAATLPGAPVSSLQALGTGCLEALARALSHGAIIGLPTDTVYGLAARWDSEAGVRRLFRAKGRDYAQPVAAIFSSVAAVKEALPDLEAAAEKVLTVLLPGPFTFVVATAVPRPALVGTEDSLGVRVPAHDPLLDFLGRLGVGVVATSANPSGQKDAATLAEVEPSLLAHCALALTAGADVPVPGRPSTVVDLRPLSRGDRPQILREGAVPASQVLTRIEALHL